MLSPGNTVNKSYTTQFEINRSHRAESWRVKDGKGNNYFLKLIDMARLSPHEFRPDGSILEANILQRLDHERISRLRDSSEIVLGPRKFACLIIDFISGETLAARFKRSLVFDSYDAIQIALEILDVLDYLHTQPEPVLHNNLVPENVLLDLNKGLCSVRLCGFGNARYLTQPRDAFKVDLQNPFHISNEGLNLVFTPQNDIFSVGSLLYKMLYGLPPWYIDVSEYNSDAQIKQAVMSERRKPLLGLSFAEAQTTVNSSLLEIVETALSADVAVRFATAGEFTEALRGELNRSVSLRKTTKRQESEPAETENDLTQRGLAGVAGMQQIKDILVNDVLRVLADKEGARKYGLSIPNGMLLYGPPGCGKTFIAQKFAEEANYNYIFIRPSDLASVYIHGSQEKIGKVFKEAREKKPSILCFDEFDDFVPRRDSINNASVSGEVNEFLTQLNNCGRSGVFVIGTTNRPDLIDIDVLRKGRFDIIIYVPPPDLEARVGLFKLYIENRPVDFGIDFDELAELTEGRVCSDIEFIVSEAARAAYRSGGRIDQTTLLEIVRSTRSSLTAEHIERYETLRNQIEGSQPQKHKTIGFEL